MSPAKQDAQILPKPGIFRTVLLSRSLTIGTLITVILIAMALISFFWTPY